MMPQRCWLACWPALLIGLAGLAGCISRQGATSPSPPLPPSPIDGLNTKGIDLGPGVVDSAYLPVERSTAAPDGYGLYTVMLTRSANPASVQGLGRILAVTVDARDAALDRGNLNLILLPVKNAAAATRTLNGARAQPEGTASALLQQHYDFAQAGLLLAELCRADRGTDVVKMCAAGSTDGPWLVAGRRPLQPRLPSGERLLVVNLSGTSPAAMGEAIAAFRRQVLRKDFDGPARYEHWRLWVLDKALVAAKLLPGIGKAYAGTP